MSNQYRHNADGSVICRHRDLSVCPDCLRSDPYLVDIYGQTFRADDIAELAQLKGLVKGKRYFSGPKLEIFEGRPVA